MNTAQLYQKTFENVKPSSEAVEEVINQLEESEQDAGHFLKRKKIAWYKRKAAVIVIIVCLFVGTTSVAAYTIKKANIKNISHEYYNDLNILQAAVDEQLTFDFQILAAFDNQFHFLDGNIANMVAYDEEGNVLGERLMLIMQYGIPGQLKYRDLWGQAEIRIVVAPLFDYQKEKVQKAKETYQSREILGIKVYYSELTAKAVSENCSEYEHLTHCFWNIDEDIVCEMEEKESRMGAEEWFSMAEQIIRIQNKDDD